MSESLLRDHCQRELRARRQRGEPVWWIKTAGGLYQRTGVPDLVICYDGEFIAPELKVEGELSPKQRFEMHLIERAGGITGVVRSVEELNSLLTR